MICYDKYGKMTPEFQSYQQEAWDKLRVISEALTAKAIQDGVCPNALRDTMTRAIECGSVLACQKSYVDAYKKGSDECHTGLVKGL